MIIIAPRLSFDAQQADLAPPSISGWADTAIDLPEALAGRRYRDILSGQEFAAGPQVPPRPRRSPRAANPERGLNPAATD